MSDLIIRALHHSDLTGTIALSSEVGWPHRMADWLFAMKTGRGLVAELNDQIVGVIMWWPNDEDHGSVGMVIVAGREQGRGLGRRLVQAAMDANPDRTLFLTATPQGAPLYQKLGFVNMSPVIRCQGTSVNMVKVASPHDVRALYEEEFATLCALDAEAVGYRRPTLLRALLLEGDCIVSEHSGVLTGYAFCRRFGHGQLLGPVAAADADTAMSLINHWLAVHVGAFVRMDVVGQAAIVPHLVEAGLVSAPPIMAMARGTFPKSRPLLYGLASQALG